MSINEQVKAKIVEIVSQNARLLKDKELVQLVEQNLQARVSVGFIRKVRQELGIVKSPGRGVCRVLDAVAAEVQTEKEV